MKILPALPPFNLPHDLGREGRAELLAQKGKCEFRAWDSRGIPGFRAVVPLVALAEGTEGLE